MILNNVSKQMENKSLEIFRASESQLFKIKHRIFSESNAEVSVVPLSIGTFNVVQNFEKEYGDKIGVTLDVSAEEALLLLSNAQDLRYTITFNHVTQHYYRIIDDIPPETRKYRVIINHPMDLLKSIQKIEVTTSQESGSSTPQFKPDDIRARRFNLQVGLVTDDLYEVRERPINNLPVNANMCDTIHCIANVLNIKKVNMLEQPDNERVYKAVPIVPMQTLGTVMDQLQDTYGCYQKGLGCYFHDNALEIYSGYDTNPNTEKALHLYRLPTQSFGGCKSYHSVDATGSIHVVLIDEVAIQNLSEMGVENVGNYQIARRSDAGLDVDVLMKGKEAEIRPNNLISSAATNEKTATTGKVSVKYVPTTNNAMTMTSEMANTMCKIMMTHWRMSWPWLLTPGIKVVYHYEEMSGLKMTTGILSSVEYALEKIAGVMGQEHSYAWAAKISCRLSANEQEEEKISKDMLYTLRGMTS